MDVRFPPDDGTWDPVGKRLSFAAEGLSQEFGVQPFTCIIKLSRLRQDNPGLDPADSDLEIKVREALARGRPRYEGEVISQMAGLSSAPPSLTLASPLAED